MDETASVNPGDGSTGAAWSPTLGRKRPSLAMMLATAVVRLRPKGLAKTEAFKAAVLGRRYPDPAAIPTGFSDRFIIAEGKVEGRRVVTLSPKAGASGWRIVYTHGGAYVNELVKPHWDIIAALIKATGATVIVPFYPLAPESDHRDAYGFLLAVYRDLVSSSPTGSIVLAGDSAGAGLAIGLTLVAREAGLPPPARLLLFSPWLDLTLADPTTLAYEAADPMLAVEALRLCGAWWSSVDDPTLPHLSPLYADPATLPPIDLFQGDNDLLVVDARTFAQGAQQASARVSYVEYAGSFHVFVGATFTPEAKDVFSRIAAVLPPKNTSPAAGP